jgi:hypothetical protein
VLNKNGSFTTLTRNYVAFSTNLNCLPIGGYEYVSQSHASTTYNVLRSHNNEMDMSMDVQINR